MLTMHARLHEQLHRSSKENNLLKQCLEERENSNYSKVFKDVMAQDNPLLEKDHCKNHIFQWKRHANEEIERLNKLSHLAWANGSNYIRCKITYIYTLISTTPVITRPIVQHNEKAPPVDLSTADTVILKNVWWLAPNSGEGMHSYIECLVRGKYTVWPSQGIVFEKQGTLGVESVEPRRSQ